MCGGSVSSYIFGATRYLLHQKDADLATVTNDVELAAMSSDLSRCAGDPHIAVSIRWKDWSGTFVIWIKQLRLACGHSKKEGDG